MKFRLTAVIVLALCLSNAFADEGMWLLGNLKKNKQTDRVMRELGLQMPVNKLYNPKKPCLADAVVSFGGFPVVGRIDYFSRHPSAGSWQRSRKTT